MPVLEEKSLILIILRYLMNNQVEISIKHLEMRTCNFMGKSGWKHIFDNQGREFAKERVLLRIQ